MYEENEMLIPKFQRLCHFILRTPLIGPSWLIFGITAVAGDISFGVRFIIAFAVLIATTFTAWPTIILTPFFMIASLFFLGQMNDTVAFFYVAYMIVGAVVYGTYLKVTFRLMTGKYTLFPLTGQIMYNPSDFIAGKVR